MSPRAILYLFFNWELKFIRTGNKFKHFIPPLCWGVFLFNKAQYIRNYSSLLVLYTYLCLVILKKLLHKQAIMWMAYSYHWFQHYTNIFLKSLNQINCYIFQSKWGTFYLYMSNKFARSCNIYLQMLVIFHYPN